MNHNKTISTEWEKEFEALVTKKVAPPVQYGGKSTTMTSESINLDDIKDFIKKALTTQQTAHEREKNNILYALGLMYLQYVSKDGHLFMSAGETAQEILEQYQLLSADEIGRGEPDWDKLDALSTLSNKDVT